MTPTIAAGMDRHVRDLLAARHLTAAQSVVFGFLLWGARRPGFDRVSVSIREIQQKTGRCRETIVQAVRAFERCGLLKKVRRWVRVRDERGILVNRQATNLYVFRPGSESTLSTVNRAKKVLDKRAFEVRRRNEPCAPQATVEEQIAICLKGATDEQKQLAMARFNSLRA